MKYLLIFVCVAVLTWGFTEAMNISVDVEECTELVQEWNECQVPYACDEGDLIAINRDFEEGYCFLLLL